jgi:hypothetical protein
LQGHAEDAREEGAARVALALERAFAAFDGGAQAAAANAVRARVLATNELAKEVALEKDRDPPPGGAAGAGGGGGGGTGGGGSGEDGEDGEDGGGGSSARSGQSTQSRASGKKSKSGRSGTSQARSSTPSRGSPPRSSSSAGKPPPPWKSDELLAAERGLAAARAGEGAARSVASGRPVNGEQFVRALQNFGAVWR